MSPGAPCSTSATCRPRSTRNCSRTTPIACRRANCSSPTRCPAATTRRKPASAPTTSSGIGRPTPEQLADFCTDASGKCHGTSIPPPLMRPDVIAWSKAQARALVAPQVAEIFERDPRPFFQAIFDFISPQIVFGRVALLGDAAFLARPHPGAGTTKCAMDAEHLADAIAAHGIDAGLAQISAPARRVRQRHRAAGPARRLLHHRPAQAARTAPQQGPELGGRRPDARPRQAQRRGGATAVRSQPEFAMMAAMVPKPNHQPPFNITRASHLVLDGARPGGEPCPCTGELIGLARESGANPRHALPAWP